MLCQDLGSLLTFLRICHPLDQDDFFKRMVLRPLKDGDPAGAELLRVSPTKSCREVEVELTALKALMSHICIRRTKEVGVGLRRRKTKKPPHHGSVDARQGWKGVGSVATGRSRRNEM